MMKRKFLPPMTKKRAVILAVGLLVALFAALLIITQIAWQQYEQRYSAGREVAVSSVETFLADGEVDRSDIDALAITLAEVSRTDCTVGWAQSWRAKTFDDAHQLEQGCESLAASATAAAERATNLRERIDQERQVGERISQAMRDVDELKAGQYQEAAKIWSAAASDLRTVEAQEALKTDVDSMADAADAIEKAYNGLQKADLAKKRPGFDDAVVDLQKAYQQLRDAGESSQRSYSESAQQLIETLRAI